MPEMTRKKDGTAETDVKMVPGHAGKKREKKII